MKKTTLILAAAIFASAACTRGLEEPERGDSSRKGTVDVEFSINVPATTVATKSISDFTAIPNIHNLYCAVFDDSGYLVQYAQATCSEGYPGVNDDITTTGTIEGAKPYKVTLNVIDKKPKAIHFIANGPSRVSFGSEEEVIASMIAYVNPGEGQIGPDVYWQRVELPQGITFDPTDSDALISSSANSLMNIGLIRNFAEFTVQVSSSVTNFVLTGAKILMSPDCGYVAPYNKTTGTFVTDYADRTVQELNNAGYIGSAPVTAAVMEDFTDNGIITPTTAGSPVSTFMFEREKPTSAPACVLIRGKYNGSDTDTWYKVNLTDSETGEYYAIMRNFNYTVNISNVVSAGKATQQEAYNTAGSGDISTTFEYKNLTSMSNGHSKLEVSYTSKVVVSNGPFELKYKFAPDMTVTYGTSNPSHSSEAVIVNDFRYTDNSSEILDLTAWDQSGVQIYLGAPGSAGAAVASISIAGSDNPDDLSRTITITPTSISATPKTQELFIVGRQKYYDSTTDTYKIRTLTRGVTIMLHQKYNLTVTCSPAEVVTAIGQPVTISFTLPKGLSRALFPMSLMIEAEQLSLSPVDTDLLLNKGNSIIEGTGRPSAFNYIKTLNWSDYYHEDTDSYTLTFDAHFSTNTENSASRVYVANDYFIPAYGEFYNPNFFTSLAFGEIATNGDVDFSFTMETVTPVTLTLTNLTPASPETRLVATGTPGVYTFTPSGSGVQTMHLNKSSEGKISVGIAATGYASNSASVSEIKTAWPSSWYTATTHTGFNGDVPFVGQGDATTLSVKVKAESTTGLTVNFDLASTSKTATLKSTTPDSDGYYTYEAAYSSTDISSKSGNCAVTVTVSYINGDSIGSATANNTLPVWVKTENPETYAVGNELTSASFDTGKEYVIYNIEAGRYLGADGNNFETIRTVDPSNDYYKFKFGGTGSPAYVMNIGNKRYINTSAAKSGGGGSVSYSASYGSNSTDLKIDYTSESGFRFFREKIKVSGTNYFSDLNMTRGGGSYSVGATGGTSNPTTKEVYWKVYEVNVTPGNITYTNPN